MITSSVGINALKAVCHRRAGEVKNYSGWETHDPASSLKTDVVFEVTTVLVFIFRGVLAIAWSLADPELLLSCGKDNRILCWNPNTAEVKIYYEFNLNAGYTHNVYIYKVDYVNKSSTWISRCCTSCPPAVSGALTSSGAPETLQCCPLQALTDTSTSIPSWEEPTRRRAKDTLTRWDEETETRILQQMKRGLCLICRLQPCRQTSIYKESQCVYFLYL